MTLCVRVGTMFLGGQRFLNLKHVAYVAKFVCLAEMRSWPVVLRNGRSKGQVFETELQGLVTEICSRRSLGMPEAQPVCVFRCDVSTVTACSQR